MDTNEIYTEFLLLSGLEEAQAAPWRPLCAAAGVWLNGLLRTGASPTDSRAVLAAAGEAYYRYALVNGKNSASSISVGGVSVSERSGAELESARTLRDELLVGAVGLLNWDYSGLRQVM